MDADDRYGDRCGRPIFRADALVDLLYQGHDIGPLTTENTASVQEYNRWCTFFDHPELTLRTCASIVVDDDPVEFHAANQRHWFMPDAYATIDIRQIALEKCTTSVQRNRVNKEMDLFEQRDMLPVVRFLHYMVSKLRAHSVGWGCGRGSSTASYVLYLLGVHKIDAIKYQLNIEEFLR